MTRSSRIAPLLAALAAALASATTEAGPNDYIRLPTVEYGEKEIDFKTGTQRNRDGTSESAHSLGLGMGATPWWFTELYAKAKYAPGQTESLDAWEWENRFQLTEPGEYPVLFGWLLELERPRDRSEGYEIVYGPMFQSDWGLVQGNFNVFLEQHLRAATPRSTDMRYQAQVKYRNSEKLEWGLQAFGEVGKWNAWDPTTHQSHRLGPALFGKFRTSGSQSIRWNAAFMPGITDGTPTRTLRAQVEYEFY